MNAPASRYVGRPIPGRSQRRYVVGNGRYVDDLPFRDPLHVAFVRSPHAHARIVSVDTSAAEAAPGVAAVAVGADLGQVAPTPVNRFAPEMGVPEYLALSVERVRYVGEPIAAVVAVTPAEAEDAAHLVRVAYEPLEAVTAAEAALEPNAPILHPEIGSNLCYRLAMEGPFTGSGPSVGAGRTGEAGSAARVETGPVEEAFARAAHVVRARVRHHRLSAAPLEPRGVAAHLDRATDTLTVWCSSQTPHQLRDDLAAALGLAQHRVRVIVPDVGGGFGAKGSTYREDVAVAALALRLGRPVKWTATRREELLSTQHSRDQEDEVEAAFDADGRLLALRTRTLCNLGAYLLGRSSRQALRVAQFATGAYRVPAHRAEVVAVFTNTVPTGAYRGAGRPEAAFLIERLMDAAARELRIDPAELRRRNFLQPGDFPHTTPNGARYDSGNYPHLLQTLLDAADYPRLLAERDHRRARGELVGIGLCTFVENTSAGWESGAVRVERDGTVTAISGATPMGQGVETVFAQIVADALAVPIERVVVRFGDTALTQAGMGSFGSRSTAVGGSALLQAAARVRERAIALAADLLETSPDDVVLADGEAYVRGAPRRRVSWAEIARAAYPGLGRPAAGEPGLEAHAFFSAEGEAISAGAYLAMASVDRETGQVRLERLVAADDCGTVVNPLLLEGQVVGAIAQGIGEALQERVVYDAAGQLLTASLLDYALPTAAQVVAPRTAHTATPSPLNPLGAKGAGEAGIIGTPPAVLNAVLDALSPLGVTHLDPPLHAEKIWRAINVRSSFNEDEPTINVER